MIPPHFPPPPPPSSVQEVRTVEISNPLKPGPLASSGVELTGRRASHLDGLSSLTSEGQKTAEKGEGIGRPRTGYDPRNQDPLVDPKQDFYRYAVGGWLKSNPLPPKGYGIWGTFHELDKTTRDRVHLLLEQEEAEEELAKGQALFRSYLDTEQRNKAGLAPIRPLVGRILELDSREAFFEEWAAQKLSRNCAFCTLGASAHPFRARYSVFTFAEGGLNLADHDMYLPERDTAENGHAKIRERYKEYVGKVWSRLGFDEISPQEAAEAVMRIETQIAKARWTKEERRDADLTANIYSLQGLKEWEPAIPYERLFEILGVQPQDIHVANPRLLKCVAQLMFHAPLDDLKIYLAFSLANATAPHLDEEMERLHFDFYEKELAGIQEPKPKVERGTLLANLWLGEAIGKSYVKRWFPPQRKARVQRMVEQIKNALVEVIQELDWMSEATKEQAIAKVRATMIQIGYPDEGGWEDYSALSVDPQRPLVENMLDCWRFHKLREFEEVERPIDLLRWPWPPQKVNACNIPTLNSLNFPAGILQSPFLVDDEPVAWGAFGAVIAHEIIHSFDDSGRKYGPDGRKEDWWTEEDAKKFEAHGKVLADYFDGLTLTFSDGSSIPVKGKMCLGENIADLGGLTVAYRAFSKAWEGRMEEKEEGFTAPQRFFLGWAQVWANTALEEEAKRRLSWDVHSPGYWRVNGTLAQLPAFWEAFDVPEGAAMRVSQEKLCRMWH